jgi:hypothetical protein
LAPLRVALIGIVLAALSRGAIAQLNSDVVPRERLVPLAEQVRRDLEMSTYRLGPFRLQPQFLLREITYTDNVFGASDEEEKVSDINASVAAGTRWILPVGPKGYLRGRVLPEYNWSAELPEWRFLGGTYDVSALALGNRLSAQATAGASRSLAVASSETEVRAIRDLRRFGVESELDVTGKISLFGSARAEQTRYDSDAAPEDPLFDVDRLDRDDVAYRAGVRYNVTSFLNFSVAGERTGSEFQENALEQDNTSDAVLLGVHYDRPHAYFDLTVGRRTGDPDNGSSFLPYEETVGSYFASFAAGRPFRVEVFGRRAVMYGVSLEGPYFIETRNGLGASALAGSRLRLRASAEAGTNDYPLPRQTPTGLVDREDEVLIYGAGFDFRLYRNVALTVFVSETDLESNVEVFDRSIVRIQTGITLTGDFPR